MKSSIINIGDSKVIVIPQDFLNRGLIEDEVNIELLDNQIVISRVNEVKRQGWAESFAEMAKNGDDQLIVPDLFDDEYINYIND